MDRGVWRATVHGLQRVRHDRAHLPTTYTLKAFNRLQISYDKYEYILYIKYLYTKNLRIYWLEYIIRIYIRIYWFIF